MNARTLDSTSGSKGKFWPRFIVGLLVVNTLAVAALIMFAKRDAPGLMEKDYYAKAVSYEQVIEQERVSLALGWKIELVAPVASGEFGIVVRDATGQSIAGALVEADIFHPAHIGERKTWPLRETSPGTYVGVLPAHYPGFWEVRVRAARAQDVFYGKTFVEQKAAP